MKGQSTKTVLSVHLSACVLNHRYPLVLTLYLDVCSFGGWLFYSGNYYYRICDSTFTAVSSRFGITLFAIGLILAFFHGMIATFVITPLVTLIWSSGTLVFSPEAGMASFYATFAIVFGLMLVGVIIFFVGRKDEKRS